MREIIDSIEMNIDLLDDGTNDLAIKDIRTALEKLKGAKVYESQHHISQIRAIANDITSDKPITIIVMEGEK